MMNAVMPRGTCLRIGLRVNHQDLRIRPIGDPHLAAIEYVFITLFIRSQAHPHHVGSGACFGHSQCARVFAAD